MTRFLPLFLVFTLLVGGALSRSMMEEPRVAVRTVDAPQLEPVETWTAAKKYQRTEKSAAGDESCVAG